MSQETEQSEQPIEIQDLDRVKEIRYKVIDHLSKNKIPDDPDEVRLLLSALSDQDRSSLGRLKAKTDDKGVKSQQDTAAIIANLLTQIDPSKISSQVVENRVIPTLGNDVEKPQIKPGETDIGISNTNYETFASTHFKSE